MSRSGRSTSCGKSMGCPSFDEALQQFRTFLAEQGQSRDLIWLAQDDILLMGRTRVSHSPRQSSAIERARKRYDDGVLRGVGVELLAFCKTGSLLGCEVWHPASRDVAERMLMHSGLKLSLRERLPDVRVVQFPIFLFLRIVGRRPSSAPLADGMPRTELRNPSRLTSARRNDVQIF